jgi:hypothetical protein
MVSNSIDFIDRKETGAVLQMDQFVIKGVSQKNRFDCLSYVPCMQLFSCHPHILAIIHTGQHIQWADYVWERAMDNYNIYLSC